jgi:hypothetical protein
MRASLLVCIAIACACGSGIETDVSPLLHAHGEIHYTLPADGCAWTVVIHGVEYAPDVASLALVRAFTHDAYGETPASIAYRLTGEQALVECGFNTSRELPEISVQAIAAP